MTLIAFAVVGLGLVVAAVGLLLVLGLTTHSRRVTEADVTYFRMDAERVGADSQSTRITA